MPQPAHRAKSQVRNPASSFEAVQAWTEGHNEQGKHPAIEIWAGSHMELQLAERPRLIAEFKLR